MNGEQGKKVANNLLARSVAKIYPSKEKLEEILLSGKKLRIYIGADATGPQLHVGHATNFMLLEKLRQSGHEVIVLFGDFTAMIGDPTDKSVARKQLTKKQVEENITSWKEQVGKILDLENAENPVRIVRNSEWLSKLNFSKMIELASSFTVQRMLERDMFEKRIQEEKPIYAHEFFYPLMQGYDSVALDVDMEIGGTDQTFNMLAGRTLQRKYNKKEKFVMTTTLLENPVTGKKLMSKSEGNFIALNDSPREMFGKTMALPDEVIVSMFTDCTYVEMDEIRKIAEELKSEKMNPRDAKFKLAKELVTIYHNAEAAKAEEKYFVETFSKKNISATEIEERKVHEGTLIDVLIELGFAESKGDARRKIEQGGVSIDGEKVTDVNVVVFSKQDGKILRVGKKHFAKLSFSGERK